MIRTPSLVLLAALALAQPGCALFSPAKKAGDEAPLSDAEVAFQRAEALFANKEWEDAQRIYEHVRVKYPFLAVATLAELRLADIQYAQEEWAAARDRYQTFVRLHPTHSEADYAAMRAAMSNYKQIPDEWFIFPPDHEKDQTAATNALRALGDFIRQHPGSRHLEEVRAAYEDTRKRLTLHELHVAEFYARRKRWSAVVTRMRTALERYPDTELSERVYFTLHDAYLQLQDPAAARQVLEEIQAKMPDTPAAERARRLAGG